MWLSSSKRGGIDTGEGIGRGEDGFAKDSLAAAIVAECASMSMSITMSMFIVALGGAVCGGGTSIARAVAMFLCLRRSAAPERKQ